LRNLLVLMMLCAAQPVLGRAITDPVKLEESVRASAIEKAKTLIKGFESLQLKAYICPGGQVTIGYGHAGPPYKMGDTITVAQAEALLESDMARFVDGVDQLVKVPLTDGQAAALASLMFNIGVGSFERSTLLRLLNGLDYEGAAAQFPRWNKSKGKVLDGLTNRREAEKLVFEGKA
jgi:lysozyme